MKKALLTLALATASVSFAQEKREPKKQVTPEQQAYVNQTLANLYQYIDRSNLPHQEVEAAKKMLDSTYKIINLK
jgi:hypothetical protein